VRYLEERFLSDYAVIADLTLEPGPGEPRRLCYRYLEGTPIAGSTTLVVEPTARGSARVTIIFEFQELRAATLRVLHGMALPRHDQAMHDLVRRAAERLGARIVASTVPHAYTIL
jgi:hypothetical protein